MLGNTSWRCHRCRRDGGESHSWECEMSWLVEKTQQLMTVVCGRETSRVCRHLERDVSKQTLVIVFFVVRCVQWQITLRCPDTNKVAHSLLFSSTKEWNGPSKPRSLKLKRSIRRSAAVQTPRFLALGWLLVPYLIWLDFCFEFALRLFGAVHALSLQPFQSSSWLTLGSHSNDQTSPEPLGWDNLTTTAVSPVAVSVT